MKLYHFTILFIVIALSLILIADIKTNQYLAVSQEKKDLDQCFNRAIDDAAKNFVESDGVEIISVNKERAVKDFYYSLYASLDISDNPEKQDQLNNYVPVMIVTCEDGYYIYYSDNYKGNDHYSYIKKKWSEKFYFYYEDKDFIYNFTLSDTLTIFDKNGLLDVTKEQKIFTINYHQLMTDDEFSNFRTKRPSSFLLKEETFYLVRKECIIDRMEKTMSYYCNQHNRIAKQYGITYNFALPITDDSDWTNTIDNPSILVLFQGYPYGNGLDTYNRFAIAGSDIKKYKKYYLEQKEWYYLYHKSDCAELKKDGIILEEESLSSVSECVKKGAYACEKCCPSEGHVPDYSP